MVCHMSVCCMVVSHGICLVYLAEPESSICRRQSSELHLSCCTAHTEQKFGEAAEKKLKENLRSRNHALKKHITNTLAKYQGE